ncbi:MAG: transposase, partial [Methanobrevibacter sp.]|nr:transposase [Methanobrevibacter sp.]
MYPKREMVDVFNQNIGNARFVWNHLLAEYKKTYSLFIQHGYTKLKCNMTTFNTMLKILKKEHSFLGLSESTSLQQVYRDLIQAFNKFFKENTGYPIFKNKSNPKQSFRIQNNKNIRIRDNQIVLPKLGPVYFRTSREYKKILNNKDTKINNVTIKRHNGKFYAVFNIETPIETYEKTFDYIGIDLGLRTLATLSNGIEKANLDLAYEEKMISKYQKILSRKKYMSKRYQKTLRTYWKWQDKKTNKIKDTYH